MDNMFKDENQSQITHSFENVKDLYLKLERNLDSLIREIPCDQEDKYTRYICQLVESNITPEHNIARNLVYDVFGVMTRLFVKSSFYVRLYNGDKKTPVINNGYEIHAFSREDFINNNEYVDVSLPQNATWCQMSGEELLEYITPEEDDADVTVFIDSGHNGIYFDFETGRYLLLGDLDGYMPCEDIFHGKKLRKAV